MTTAYRSFVPNKLYDIHAFRCILKRV